MLPAPARGWFGQPTLRFQQFMAEVDKTGRDRPATGEWWRADGGSTKSDGPGMVFIVRVQAAHRPALGYPHAGQIIMRLPSGSAPVTIGISSRRCRSVYPATKAVHTTMVVC